MTKRAIVEHDGVVSMPKSRASGPCPGQVPGNTDWFQFETSPRNALALFSKTRSHKNVLENPLRRAKGHVAPTGVQPRAYRGAEERNPCPGGRREALADRRRPRLVVP